MDIQSERTALPVTGCHQHARRLTTDDPGRRTFPPGALVADTDRRQTHNLIVESGVIAIFAGGSAEHATCVSLVGPGAVIGPDIAAAAGSGLVMTFLALSAVRSRSVSREAFEQALRADPAFCVAYAHQLQARLAASYQIAACQMNHSLASRCAHWLLKLRGWFGDVLPVTHACLATILGARRAGVGVILQNLQRAGAIGQQRGRIQVLDDAAVRASACVCPILAESNPGPALASAPTPWLLATRS